MRKTKADKLAATLNEAFGFHLAEAFKRQWGARLETEWSLFVGRWVSRREDGGPLTAEQAAWIGGFEAAWLLASVHACVELRITP